MRIISGPTTTEVAKTITRPGYLFRMEFPGEVIRLSSRQQVTWFGNTWTPGGFEVEGLTVDGSQSELTGSVSLLDYDNRFFQLIMTHGVGDRIIDILAFWGSGAALGVTDTVHLFHGVGDEATIDPKTARCTITLQQSESGVLFCPRRYITREQGFSVLPAEGTKVEWNEEIFILGTED